MVRKGVNLQIECLNQSKHIKILNCIFIVPLQKLTNLLSNLKDLIIVDTKIKYFGEYINIIKK